jgi:parvulin-like peptidyl-prolyl isomerase
MRHWACLAAAVLGLACRERPAADPVILELGELSVRRSAFDAHLEALRSRGLEGAEQPAVLRGVLEAFLEERVLVLEARRRGLLSADATPEQEQAGARALLTEAGSRVTVGDAEIAAYYEAHRSELAQPEEVTLRQILVPTLNEARDARRRLARDPRSFEALAQTRSRGPEASAGGLMGTFTHGELPVELEAAAFALSAGATSDPVESPLGYHVLRVDGRAPARERSLDECREEIRRTLLRDRSDAAGKRLVQTLLGRAKVNHEAVTSRPRS